MAQDPETLRTALRRLLDLPAQIDVPTATETNRQVNAGVVQADLMLGALPATFLCPEGAGPHPAVLYCHAHGGKYDLGRRELMDGAPWLCRPAGPDLVKAGFAALCIDVAGFGDRQTEGSEDALTKAGLWYGKPLFGQMIADQMRALAWLRQNPLIDETRIATYGTSMGAAHSFWLSALDPQIACAVHFCMLANMAEMIDCGAFDRHGHYLTVPGLLTVTDMGEIAGLVAPRPQYVGHGDQDHLTPAVARDPALAQLRAAYGDNNLLITELAENSGHVETTEMRQAALAFLARNLT